VQRSECDCDSVAAQVSVRERGQPRRWAGEALAQALHQLARVASLEADTLEGVVYFPA
jgi:hypothetical protein